MNDLVSLVARQAAQTTTAADAATTSMHPQCDSGNDFDGRIGLRVSSIFVILVGSFLGTWFPVFAARHRGIGVPQWAFFVAKFFGSGVIIATAFIHLLAPANDALTDPCLTGPITDYSWPEGIALMTIFVLFFVELMTMRYAKFGHSHSHGSSHDHDHGHGHAHGHVHSHARALEPEDGLGVVPESKEYSDDTTTTTPADTPAGNTPRPVCPTAPHVPGDDHLSHARRHVDNDDVAADWPTSSPAHIHPESYAAQMTAIFILEFGVVFHSVFVGLTLAVAGSEFTTLYVVLVFHQTFEGLGLGSRLAAIPWPRSKRWTPYLLGAGYSISTPIAIAVGLGVRTTYPPGSQTTLIVNGVFDSISAGILIYTGLVELMAHEFMFSNYMQRASIKTVLFAFGTMCAGAGLMALLGKWA